MLAFSFSPFTHFMRLNRTSRYLKSTKMSQIKRVLVLVSKRDMFGDDGSVEGALVQEKIFSIPQSERLLAAKCVESLTPEFDQLFRFRVLLSLSRKENGKEELAHPSGLKVKINGAKVLLPEPKCDTARAKEIYADIDLTPLCFSDGSSMEMAWQLTLSWSKSSRTGYCFEISVCQESTPAALYYHVLSSRASRAALWCKERIAEHFASDTEDVIVQKITLSLYCPISRKRIQTPVKSVSCKHLDCFDLKSFLEMNGQEARWECPICRASANVGELLIEQFYADLLRDQRTKGATEVEIGPEGISHSAIPLTGLESDINAINIDCGLISVSP